MKSGQFRQGSIYRRKWVVPLDRRQIEIENIDFVADGKAGPILLGITGVVEW